MSSDPTLTDLTPAERRRLLKMALARDLERKGSELRPIERADREGRLPLSFAQQRLWFLEQLGDLGSTYHIAKRLRLRGPLDRAALTRALDGIVARHEVLRTTFAEVDGVPEQRIAPAAASGFHLVEHDLEGHADAEAELGRLTFQEARARFDLERGPLVRGRLIRLAEDDHVLLVTMHHVVSDGWSTGVFFGELSALYAACAQGREATLPELPVQYADFAVWQRRWVEGDVLRQQADYWTRTLTGAPELLEIPADRPRPAEIDHTGARVDLALDAALTAGLKALSRRHGATLYMTILAGWAVVLGRLSGQEDVVVGTPAAGRRRPEVEKLIGFFVNTLALRLDLSGAPTVAELLGRVKERVLDAQHHQDMPFEQVVERVDPVRSMSHHPLFQVLFAWQNTRQGDGDGPSLPGLSVGHAGGDRMVTAKLDLSLSMWEAEDRIVGGVTYSTALFERATVERYVGYLRRVLEQMAADEGRRVDRLALMPASERERVVEEWNRTEADYGAASCIHTLFEARAARTPDAVAVTFEGEHLAYAELDARANRLAHHLRGMGVGPDVRVGISLERGPEMMVGLMAILKAGGAYVPLDPSYPEERLAYMLADSAPAVLLTHGPPAVRFAEGGVPVVDLADPAPWAHRPGTAPAVAELTPDHACYVIYTSGSTGRPKGVVNRHRAVANLLAWSQDTWRLRPAEAVLQRISFSFDVSVREIFWPLTAGARLVVARPGGHADPDYVVDLIRRERIGTAHLPGLLRAFVEHPEAGTCTSLVRVINGGEALAPAVARRFGELLPDAALYHMYGPTETTVASSWLRWTPDVAGTVAPIGRPIANTRIYVLDARGEPVPTGVAGEICIGGSGVARGYLDRPAATAERFVADPFSTRPGARMYRTGDVGRWKESAGVRECGSAEAGSGHSRTDALPHSRMGVLEFLGRGDGQVKVRGYRIETGEIESRLTELAGVRAAVVAAREDVPGEKRLVAYVVGDETAGADALRTHLAASLPAFMVPAAFVRLEQFPLTPNGKVDRGALPAPEGDAYAARAYEPPAGDVEEILAGIWAKVLGVERVGRRDDFFDLGGHSLLAVQVISRVRQVLGVKVALGDLFTRPVLGDFARELVTVARAALPPIEPAGREGRLPLSFAQQRLWFLEQMGGLGSTYHIPGRLRLRGELDRDALVRALDGIVARHESLRTTFAEVDGVPEQRIAPADAGFHLVEHELGGREDAEAELGRLIAAEARAPFDLERGPLIRGRLIRLAANDHVLLLTRHHIVSDAWSGGVFMAELSALYAAYREGREAELAPLPVQYADYAAWQRRWVEGEVLEAQAEYWTRTLADAPELLELPADRPRPVRQDFAGATLPIALDEALTVGLKALGRRHGTTLFMTVLAGWAAVLGRLSGQAEVVIGTPSANRGRREIEGLIGFFLNSLPLRIDLSGAPTVAELLGRARARALEAQANQDIPFEQVVERVQPARSMAYPPVFQVLFAWQSAGRQGLELPGVTLGPVAAPSPHGTAKFDLTLSLRELDGRIAGQVEYATSLFDGATVQRHADALLRVLRAMAAAEDARVDRLPILSDAERRQVIEGWNATDADYPAHAVVHELVAAQAARTPDVVALAWDGGTMSYGELNARANRLAHFLVELGVGPDVCVGLCVERSPEMVIGLLAALKAGGAYVPLDPGYPEDRLRYMLEDSAPAVLLTRSALRGRFGGLQIPVFSLDADASAWSDRPASDPARGGLTPRHLMYVMYTSGSTGRPKGVMVGHGSAVNRMAWMQAERGMTAADAMLQKTTYAFDVSMWEFFWPLITGARLVLARPDGHRDPAYLVRTVREAGVTDIHFVPSMLPLFLEEPGAAACTGLRRVYCSGEALPPALVRRFRELLPHAVLRNEYGPTETGEVSYWRYAPGDAVSDIVPIGFPIANTRLYVLDAQGQPVPRGVAGELLIGGVALGRGYWNRPALTAERFVPDPFGEPGARLYRTGDLCRWMLDGAVEYLGRNDFQVKIRGFRVELGDIESRLAQHPAVCEAAVVAREESPGDWRLVAYYVAEEPTSIEALRAHLGEALPEYMVPAAFVHLRAWPLTPTGKLDRRALPAPDGGAFAMRGYEAPVTDAEAAVAGIWARVLGVERVGRHDHFFELGGHSLLAVQVISRVRQVLEVEAELGELFTRPVLHDFARALETAARSELPPIEPAGREGRLPLSFAQQRLWFLEQLGGVGAAYHIPMRLRLRGELDRVALARALDGIVARHEALRTVFAQVDGVPEQRIAPADIGFHLVENDLGGREDAEGELRRLMADEARAPFDPEQGPLIRGRLIRLAPDDHVLLVTMHHIVSDGWSMGVLTGELSVLYAAHREGREADLPALPVQYADYAAWQRRWIEGEVLQAQAEYWTRTLAGAPELLELPTDRPRPARMDPAGALLAVELDEDLTAGLKALSRRHGTTLFMTMLAGWAAVLGRIAGQDDVVIGTPTAGRGRREIEGLIGFFVGTLALRMELSGAPTVAELLGRVKKRVLEAQHHQDIPFEQVVDLVAPVRSLSHTPLYQAMFAWQSTPRASLALPGLTLGRVDAPAGRVTVKQDVGLTLGEANGRVMGSVAYATSLFDHDTVERWAGYLRRVLEEMVADDRRLVSRLPMLPESERRLVLEEWNRTDADFPGESCAHELFERQVERVPHALALACGDVRLSYAELNTRANQLAHHLLSLGVGPDARVAISLERGPGMVVALLAVLKARGAYVPLDPDYPEERLRWMLADSAPALLLTTGELAPRFADAGVPLLDLSNDAARVGAPETDPGRGGLRPEHPAYVIYTSGSTGRPKGAMIQHRNVCGMVAAQERSLPPGPESRVLQFASFSFDGSVYEVFLALARGASLHLPGHPGPLAGDDLVRIVAEAGITHAIIPPAVLAALPDDERLPSIHTLIVSGDAPPVELMARWSSGRRLINGYGPTEATVCTTLHDYLPGGSAPPPIGRPVANVRVYLLDAAGEPVPRGTPGELHVGGATVGRGYWRRAALTAERFVPDPFGHEPGARLYRTGDLARWNARGELEFAGRVDAQVKVRGFRIEPGEIEARLKQHAGVREAAVLVREDAPGDRRLVAYVVGDETAAVDVLRAHVGDTLPEYMLPAAYVRLDHLPLTPNGKLDRGALPAPGGDAFARRGYEAPAGETETTLAEIWAQVLGIDRVGRHDGFFELGGHSLLAVTLIQRMRRQGLHADVRTLFAGPTLAALAAAVGGEHADVRVPANRIPDASPVITPEMLPLVTLGQAEIDGIGAAVPGGAANVQDVYPLAPLQEGFLFHHLATTEGDPYLLGTLSTFSTRARVDAYLEALNAVIARHDILRTAIVWENVPEPVQVVWRAAPLPVEEVELDPAAGDVAAQLYRRFDPRHHRIDVRRAPLLRGYVAYDADGEGWVLLLLLHHLAGDHTALEVLRTEIQAHLSGRADSLSRPEPFRNFVAQARLGVSQEEHRAFFTEMLGDVDEPTAPFGLLDARGDGSGIGEARAWVDEALAARLRECARALGVSAATLCHVAWGQVLARVSGRDDVVFGTVLFGRMQGGEGADRVMGPFINTLPIRVRTGGVEAEEGVRQTHALLVGLMRHEHASLALAQRCSGVEAPAPLFTSLLNYRHSGRKTPANAPAAAARPAAGGTGKSHTQERSNYPLAMSVDDVGEGFRLTAQVHASVDPARVCRFMETALEGLVDALERAPSSPLAAVDVLPAEERRLVVHDWTAATSFSAAECLHERFQAQAARTPGAAAVSFGGQGLSYAELNARANRLAHHLRAIGVGPDARVALCAERGIEMVVGVLAILKAGGGYVPLDPAYPAERLRYTLHDSAPVAVLTFGAVGDVLSGVDVPVLDLARAAAWAHQPETNPATGVQPHHLAYVIYTSGSTGTPKGVMVEHRHVVRLFEAAEPFFGFGADDVWTLFHSIAFDFSVWEIWGALLYGGRVVVVPREVARAPEEFYRLLCREGVTVLNQTPSAFRQLSQAQGDEAHALRYVVFGGEALEVAGLRGWYTRNGGRTRLVNMYGITETTVHVTLRPMEPADVERGGASPIGRALPDLRTYILDGQGRPAPVGVAGELYVGGAGVARGYLNRPQLTAERFVRDPFVDDADARMYRSGDLGRWLPDGSIEYLGRNDFQVKVRGFRIELGEIEACLAEHPGVREAVVVAREDTPGDTRLVAYVAGDETAGGDGLRAHVGQTLPAHMVPAAYVRMERWPLTPSGKLDRRALPAPGGDAFGARAYQAPRTETEEALAAIWAEVLRVERVGRDDNFFALGGHSLLAVQVISRVRQLLEVEAALGELFTRPVLGDFARALETAARSELPPIEPAAREGSVPLSFAQTRLWFLEQFGSAGAAYHIPLRLRMRGELHRDALVRALDGVVARHEALRTVFAQVDGAPEQRIAPADVGFYLREHDLAGRTDAEAELGRLRAEEVRAPFDLERGPLIRGRLVRLAADDHVLLVTMHHIVSDGWSMGVLTRELGALYGAFRRGEPDPLPALPVQYADYAAWQRRWVEGDVLRAQADYWAQTLAGAPALLELPADHPRPAQMDHAGAQLPVELDEALTAGLKALSRRHGTTLFMTLLAGWAVVLSRLSGQDDVVIGTPTAGRGRREIEGLIGFFVNTLALRMDLSNAPTVAELLGRVKKRALAAQHHQDLPFEQVVERVDPARSMAQHPLFQVMFTWQNTPRGRLELPGLEVGGVRGAGASAPEVQAKFDLSLSLQAAGDRIVGGLTYAAALFERETVERWMGSLRRVLEEMVADEHRRVERLPMLPPAERARVVDAWNRTEAPYPAGSCVHELFEAQVARTPHAVALVHQEGRLTYGELNARANRLAHHLVARGVGPDVCVGLCLERGPEMIVALLAVLKAGGAYVPLDPEYPAERLGYMLADAAPAVLLTQASLAGLFAGPRVPRVRVDADAAAWAHASPENPERGALTPDHLAYVIYTSGSTGRPKGVMNQHRALVNRLAWGRRAWKIDADEALLCKTSLNFDGSVREILLPLTAGARVVIAPAGAHRDPSCLLEVIGRERITTVNLVPSLLQVLLDAPEVESLGRLRRVLCGGEALSGALLERFRAALPGVELHNLYGPSEAATAVTAPRLSARAGRAAVPIGGPSANARVYVLDGAGEPVPVGVAGELYIGGVPVARGYLRRAALTAERFVPDPFGGGSGARLYRTGDVVRWLADGWLDFVGRDDAQVKVRGFRVEPGEIEARLREHPGVREAVVLVREDVPGDRRLVAYCVADPAVEVDSLRAHLAERLPEYMVPAAYVRLEALPLTPNGKLDRRALPAPGGDAYVSREYEPPVNETEEALAGIWAEVLRVERVGRGDNFFALGGHSLLAVRVIARMRQALGVQIPLSLVFSHPTVESLAARLSAPEAPVLADRAVAIRAAGSEPPLFLAYTGAGSIAYTQVLHPHLDGDVPVYALPAPPPSDAQPRTVAEMAARLVRMIREVQPAGPYRVAGWSFGGVLAYEAASRLMGENETVEFLGMIDTYAPAHASMDAADADAGGGGATSPDTAGTVMRERRRVHQQALREYDPRPLPVVVHLFPAQESEMEDPSRGWGDLLPERSLRVTPVPGTHHSMMGAPNAAVLGEALSRGLEGARAGGTARAGDDASPS